MEHEELSKNMNPIERRKVMNWWARLQRRWQGPAPLRGARRKSGSARASAAAAKAWVYLAALSLPLPLAVILLLPLPFWNHVPNAFHHQVVPPSVPRIGSKWDQKGTQMEEHEGYPSQNNVFLSPNLYCTKEWGRPVFSVTRLDL